MAPGPEILIDASVAMRGQRMLKALAAAAPGGADVRANYSGQRRMLVVWGGGRPDRVELLKRHRAAGGITIAWDLAYWDRDHAARLGINTLHPTAKQIDKAPAGAGRREFELREDANPDGPILLVGLGPKSARMLGIAPLHWERKKLAEIRRRFPGRDVLWRPKGTVFQPLDDTSQRFGMPIEEALRGVSLVVCRHSNVAVDACVAGVPVECEDGAAAALYRHGPNPNREERAEFLRKLTWWEWRPSEAAQAWAWIERVVGVQP